MSINIWTALVLVIDSLLIAFVILMVISLRHEEKMMWLKIEEIKTRWETTGLYEKAKASVKGTQIHNEMLKKKRGKKND